MQKEIKEIAVIIPVYNSADVVQEALDSVLNQSYRPFEIIVVDDGSTDHTSQIVKKYGTPVRYVYQENGGPAKARNAGILATRCEYIAFLDSDDIWFPHKLQEQTNMIDAQPHLDLIFSDAVFFDDKREGRVTYGSFWKDRGCYEEMMKEHHQIQRPFAKLMDKNFILPSTALVKRACFQKVGTFDESFRRAVAEDKDMWLRISVSFQMGCVPKPLIMRRSHYHSPELIGHIHESVIAVIKKMDKMYPEIVEKEKVDTRLILGPRYYLLGRCYLDRTILPKAKEAFLESLRNSFTMKSLIFLLVALLGTKPLSILRRIKGIFWKPALNN